MNAMIHDLIKATMIGLIVIGELTCIAAFVAFIMLVL
jgi:hypothetical protein